MSRVETGTIGQRGSVVIPPDLRGRYGMEEGSEVAFEEREEGILIRPLASQPVEIYSDRRKAEFLLCNAVDAEDYAAALEEVRKMGLDPSEIPHAKPKGC